MTMCGRIELIRSTNLSEVGVFSRLIGQSGSPDLTPTENAWDVLERVTATHNTHSENHLSPKNRVVERLRLIAFLQLLLHTFQLR
ncbi:hypothetical protein TNCV_352231 [Trichonephila clavipes]|nr:hypothetical protein TNCV_352231 [Trichonephila clavipes]